MCGIVVEKCGFVSTKVLQYLLVGVVFCCLWAVGMMLFFFFVKDREGKTFIAQRQQNVG